MLTALLALATIAAPTDTAKYKIDVAFAQKASVGTQEIHLTGFLTLTERDTTVGKIAEFRLDSIKVAPGKAIPAALQGDPATARGIVYRGLIVRGAVSGGFQMSANHPQARMLTQGLDNIYPGFRASLKSGDQWSDTAKVNTVTPVAQDKTTIAKWHVVSLTGDQIVAEAATSGSMTIRQPSGAGERTDEITMSGMRRLAGPLSGPMKNATVSSEQQQLTTLPGVAAPVPATVSTSVTISRLP